MAATNNKIEYATSQSITWTLDSLASTVGTSRECTAIDNSTNKYFDAEVYISIVMATGTPSSDKCINIYSYAGYIDAGSTSRYTDNATGSDAGITLRSPTNLRLLASIQVPDSGGLTYIIIIPSVASVWGGVLSQKWGLVAENRTGVAFSTGCVKEYRGVYSTSGG